MLCLVCLKKGIKPIIAAFPFITEPLILQKHHYKKHLLNFQTEFKAAYLENAGR